MAAARLNPLDLYDIRSQLSDEERMVQDSVARFTDEKVLPIIGDCFDQGRFPTELIPEIAGLGLLGATIPEEYGGAGMNGVCYGLICQELERGDSGLRSFASVQSSLCMYPIFAYGSEEQKQRYLPKMAAGEIIGCFGLTEPHGGSDPANMKTVAKKDGDDWVLNGAKMWITNGNLAHIAIVWAQTDDGIRGFIVPTDSKGFTAQEVHKKMSLRASVTSALFLDDVRVPGDALLPEREGPEGPAGLPDPGPLRHHLGPDRRRPGVPQGSRWTTPPSASCSAARSTPTRPCSSSSPTWRVASPPRNCCRCSWGASRTPARWRPRRSRWPSGTTCAWPSTSRASAATCWAAPASPPSMRRSAMR